MNTNLLKTFFVALLLITATGASAHDFCVNGIYYNITDATAKTVKVTYKGGSYSEYDNEYTGSVVIPSMVTYNNAAYSVTSIGKSAFEDCTALTSITIPNSITSIGEDAFNGTAWYNNQLDGLVYAGKVLYKYKGTMPQNTSITIKEGTLGIGSSAFSGCSGLTSVEIPNSVICIGEDAFNGTAWYNNQLDGLVYAGKVLYKYKGTMPQNTSITIKEGTLGIGSSAFSGCSGLTSVEIPNSVTSIGDGAFEDCSGLTGELIIPNSVTSIGSRAFEDCRALTGVTIGNSVTSIGNSAFSGCSGLTGVTIGNSVTGIGSGAFCNCYGLTSITIPNSVTSIGDYAFSGCRGLTGELTIPNSVTSIGNYAFYVCRGLTGITIPNSVTSIGSGAFYGCRGLTGITIPNSVTSIGDYAFCNCTGLTGELIIPNSVTSIGDDAFCNCTGLTGELIIPNSVTSVGDNAFRYCDGLTSITIPNSVTSIGDGAFEDCTNLKNVVNLSSLSIEKGSIGNGYVAYYADKVINVPNGSVEGDYVFGVVDGVNTLCGYIGNGGEITLPADYKGENYVIGADVFKNNTALIGVTIGNSVTSIGYSAFEGCTGLTGITIPNSVTSIEGRAFILCSGLTSVTIGNSVTSIGYYAFSCCSGLTSITIPNSVTSIGRGAFEECTGLTGITIPNSVTSIGSGAFYGCRGLTGITIPSSVTSIGGQAFMGCTGLTSITIPNSVTSIGDYAFYACRGLTSITIPNSVTSIGDGAFEDCTSLKTVYNFSSLELTKGSTNNGYVAYYADKVINAPNGSVEGDYVFGVVDGVNTLCGYIGNGGEITLPADYKGENYVIGADVFKNNTALIGVTIPNSVTSIESGAFEGCTGLKTVYNFSSLELTKGSTNNGYVAYYADKVINAPNGSVEGDYVFSVVDGVNTLCVYIGNGGEITLPADYKGENYVIGADVFKNNTALIGVTIPNSVTSIGNSAFEGCTGLTSITIPNSVTTIGNSAFYGCSGLSRVTIGKNVKTIEDNAFSGCHNLSDVINASSLNIVKGSAGNGYVGYYADLLINANDDLLEGDFVFGVIDGKNTLCGYIGNDAEIVLPANYNGENYLIGKRAFYHRNDLVSITIPNSVTSIGYRAFYGCSNLKRIINFSSCYLPPYSYDCVVINAPNGHIEGDYVFGVVNDGENALCGYIGNDTEIVLPANYKGGDYIISSKFQGVTKITLPDFVKEIVHSQFQKCVDLNSIVMPDNITSIGAYAFQYCDLRSIHIPASLVEIGDYAFTWNLNLSSITVDKNNPVYYVPDGYKNIIMERATNKIVFACKGAVIPETATAIGNGAFNGVGGIESITIPAGITSIGDWAFDGCRDLKVIYALSETPVELPYNVFSNDAKSAITLYVPIGAKEAYATAWGFDNIVETDFTGVDGVTADKQTGGNELYYDLSGRAVKNPANGIYIYKGKKVLVE